jgi:predicted nucleic acid-binding protein
VIYLVDTNVLLRLANRNHPLNMVMRAAVRKLQGTGHSLMAASQNFVEFWNVATRPAARNGMGWTLTEADRLLRLLERIFQLFPDAPAVYAEWRRLVVALGVSGAKVHDARLVARMRFHAASHVLTLNTGDFARYAALGVVAVDPQTV